MYDLAKSYQNELEMDLKIS